MIQEELNNEYDNNNESKGLIKYIWKELIYLIFALIFFLSGIYYGIFCRNEQKMEIIQETYEFNREYLGIE